MLRKHKPVEVTEQIDSTIKETESTTLLILVASKENRPPQFMRTEMFKVSSKLAGTATAALSIATMPAIEVENGSTQSDLGILCASIQLESIRSDIDDRYLETLWATINSVQAFERASGVQVEEGLLTAKHVLDKNGEDKENRNFVIEGDDLVVIASKHPDGSATAKLAKSTLGRGDFVILVGFGNCPEEGSDETRQRKFGLGVITSIHEDTSQGSSIIKAMVQPAGGVVGALSEFGDSGGAVIDPVTGNIVGVITQRKFGSFSYSILELYSGEKNEAKKTDKGTGAAERGEKLAKIK